jgi:hypothetical protein
MPFRIIIALSVSLFLGSTATAETADSRQDRFLSEAFGSATPDMQVKKKAKPEGAPTAATTGRTTRNKAEFYPDALGTRKQESTADETTTASSRKATDKHDKEPRRYRNGYERLYPW